MSTIAVGTYLRVLRNAAGLSQEEAAVQAGISAKTLGRWEKGSGDHEPTVTNLKQLVQVLVGSVRDAMHLLVTEDATERDGDSIAKTWLEMPAPLLCQDGSRRFTLPALGEDKGGRLFVCTSETDAAKLKTYYDELGKASALFHSWTYQKGGVLVQLNGELDQATADKYGAVVAGL